MDDGITLDDYDKAAVLALLIRQVRAQDIAAKQEIIKAEAEDLIKDAKIKQNLGREALKAFGFDIKEKLWDQVKDAIGKESFEAAFHIARSTNPKVTEIKQIEHKKDQEEDVENDEEFGEESEVDDDEAIKPKIRDLVLQTLERFDGGLTSSSIRTSLEDAGIDMHEKTVGMTLYRLSKDELVVRNGRLWSLARKQNGSQANPASEPPV